MHPSDLKQRLRGVLAFAPTPFTTDDAVDLDGLARQVDHLCGHGVHAVVVCGGVGEFYALDADEHRACVAAAVAAADGRAPVLAGIGHSTRIAVRLAAAAREAGADGLMVNPLYFVDPDPAGLVGHYQALGDASGLGLIVFSTRAAPYTATLLARVAEVEAVVGLKDECGDLRSFCEARDRLGDRLAWINGMAETLAAPYFGAGADAMTSGVVNIAPELVLGLWQAGSAGRLDEVRELVAQRLRPIAALRERRKGYSTVVIKAAMNALGLPGGGVRSPLTPLAAEDLGDLERALAALAPVLA